MAKHITQLILLVLSLALSSCTANNPLALSLLAAQSSEPALQEALVTHTDLVTFLDEEASSIIQTKSSDEQVISLYESSSPSVVNVTSIAFVYNRMLGQLPEEGIGSGFVYDDSGHIITNYHVIENADELMVTLGSGEEFQAQVVGVDAANDLAVLLIDTGEKLPVPLPLADSDNVRVGETVLAIGNPYGLDQTLTTGVVSALGRVIESTVKGMYISDAIQTDAAINPGNSGGPLLNISGEVIGINSQIISNSGSSAGVGFAISANTINRIVPEIIANGYYLHPWLGVQTIDLTANSIVILTEAGMAVPVEAGVLVVGIESGSPAEKAGLSYGDQRVRFGPYIVPLGGDIITAINQVPVETQQDLMVFLETQAQIGEIVNLSIIRDGQLMSVSVSLTAQLSN